MSGESPLLVLESVTKHYPTVPEPTVVLRGISLVLEPGESMAIVGPSGCGKSTLLNIIGTLDTPSSGSIVFSGNDLQELSAVDAARLRNRDIGLVFQHHHLLPQCTALENVLVPTMVNRTKTDVRARALALLDRVGLADRLDRRPSQLSGGERQRVAVVRALINEPALLLADEPTGSLNRKGAEELAELLTELNRERGMALIVVTHAEDIAAKMGRLEQLNDGVLTSLG